MAAEQVPAARIDRPVRPRSADGPVPGLTRVLAGALRALGDAGHQDDASRLAAEAWVLLRHDHHSEAERLTGVLHYLARRPASDVAASSADETAEPPVATGDRELDVRSAVPARRHELIFATYLALPPGNCFVLVNDHDPKPLYYQFAAEHAGEFSWEPLETGPTAWRVRIGRTLVAGRAAGNARA